MEIHSKSRLAVILSQIDDFDAPSAKEEQYELDSEIAADLLWQASFLGDIEGKTVADFGCGPGILGIGALLLGAAKVVFIDQDEGAIKILKSNLSKFEGISERAECLQTEIEQASTRADTIIQNPPFGTKVKHADREFILKAFRSAPIVYSFHKSTSTEFLKKIAEDNGFEITHQFNYALPIKASMLFHKKPVKKVAVGCWRFLRKDAFVLRNEFIILYQNKRE